MVGPSDFLVREVEPLVAGYVGRYPQKELRNAWYNCTSIVEAWWFRKGVGATHGAAGNSPKPFGFNTSVGRGSRLMSAASSAADRLLALCLPSLVPTSTDEHHIEKLSAMFRVSIINRVVQLIRVHSANSIRLSYQSDATPTKTMEAFRKSLGAFSQLRVAGYRTSEYLLHRCFLSTSCGKHMVGMAEPRRIADNDDDPLECCVGFVVLPLSARVQGHLGDALCV